MLSHSPYVKRKKELLQTEMRLVANFDIAEICGVHCGGYSFGIPPN